MEITKKYTKILHISGSNLGCSPAQTAEKLPHLYPEAEYFWFSELYFENHDIQSFAQDLDKLYPLSQDDSVLIVIDAHGKSLNNHLDIELTNFKSTTSDILFAILAEKIDGNFDIIVDTCHAGAGIEDAKNILPDGTKVFFTSTESFVSSTFNTFQRVCNVKEPYPSLEILFSASLITKSNTKRMHQDPMLVAIGQNKNATIYKPSDSVRKYLGHDITDDAKDFVEQYLSYYFLKELSYKNATGKNITSKDLQEIYFYLKYLDTTALHQQNQLSFELLDNAFLYHRQQITLQQTAFEYIESNLTKLDLEEALTDYKANDNDKEALMEFVNDQIKLNNIIKVLTNLEDQKTKLIEAYNNEHSGTASYTVEQNTIENILDIIKEIIEQNIEELEPDAIKSRLLIAFKEEKGKHREARYDPFIDLDLEYYYYVPIAQDLYLSNRAHLEINDIDHQTEIGAIPPQQSHILFVVDALEQYELETGLSAICEYADDMIA